MKFNKLQSKTKALKSIIILSGLSLNALANGENLVPEPTGIRMLGAPLKQSNKIQTDDVIKQAIVNGLDPISWKAWNWEAGTTFSNAQLALFNPHYSNVSGVELVGSPTYTDLDPIVVQTNTLENDSNVDQTMTTSEYSTTFENSATTTTTSGWKLGTGMEVTETVGIPFVAKGSVKITVSGEYNSSTSDATTKSTSVTSTASRQNVNVPAHTILYVRAMLSRTQASGKYKFAQSLDGDARVNFYATSPSGGTQFQSTATSGDGTDIAKLLYWSTVIPEGVSLSGYPAIMLTGEGNYNAVAGVDFSVVITPYNTVTHKYSQSYMLAIPTKQTTVAAPIANTRVRFW